MWGDVLSLTSTVQSVNIWTNSTCHVSHCNFSTYTSHFDAQHSTIWYVASLALKSNKDVVLFSEMVHRCERRNSSSIRSPARWYSPSTHRRRWSGTKSFKDGGRVATPNLILELRCTGGGEAGTKAAATGKTGRRKLLCINFLSRRACAPR